MAGFPGRYLTLSAHPAQYNVVGGSSADGKGTLEGGEGGKRKHRKEGGGEGENSEAEVIALSKRAWIPRISQFLSPQMLPLYL